MPATFISYRREDSAGYAGRLHEELEGRFSGQGIFRDVDTLRAGQDFVAAIRERLRECQACVVLIGPGWLKAQTADGQPRLQQPDDYVCMEIAEALRRPDVLVVPVLVAGARMPASKDLPETIRGLGRRHALTVRDETWEADMDRLAEALSHASPASNRPGATPPGIGRGATLPRWAIPIGLALVLVSVTAFLWRKSPNTDGSTTPSDRPAASAVPAATSLVPGSALAIDAPARSEIRLGDVIFAILSGSVQARGDTTRVWLRVRASNEHRTGDANVTDSSFRLALGDTVVPATGGLNEILSHYSLRQYVVRFDVPSGRRDARLRIDHAGEMGSIPLELTPNGQPGKHDEVDARDGLSHATIVDLVRRDDPLVATGDLATAMLGVRVRRFLNKQQVRVTVRWNNDGRYPEATGGLTLRLAAGGEVQAPRQAPSEVIQPKDRYIGDVFFEVPPEIRSVVLKASLRDVEAERTIPLQ
jgi:TIR domain